MRPVLLILIGVALGGTPSAGARQAQPHSYVPSKGFVPDSVTATRIAEAVWTPIYGATAIRSEQPHVAKLRDSVWTVVGSLPKGMLGGVAVIEIDKRDARILRVSHGQ